MQPSSSTVNAVGRDPGFGDVHDGATSTDLATGRIEVERVDRAGTAV
jgi:hypothetical protein